MCHPLPPWSPFGSSILLSKLEKVKYSYMETPQLLPYEYIISTNIIIIKTDNNNNIGSLIVKYLSTKLQYI